MTGLNFFEILGCECVGDRGSRECLVMVNAPTVPTSDAKQIAIFAITDNSLHSEECRWLLMKISCVT